MKKKLFTLVMCALMAFGLAACGGEGAKTEEPKAIDEQAMSIVAKGFEKRADVITKNGNDSSNADNLKEAIQAEIDNDAQLKSAKFDDSKMQEAVLAYVNSLDAQMEVLDNTQYQSVDFFEKWQPAYDKRSALLKALVDNYGLTVGEKYQERLLRPEEDRDRRPAQGTARQRRSREDRRRLWLLHIHHRNREHHGLYLRQPVPHLRLL